MPEGRNRRLTLLLCCVAQFMVVLDVSIVNVALPSVRADLGFSGADLQWVVNGYTLTFAGFLLLGGRAADLAGPRVVFVSGLGLFALASLVGGLASSPTMLVVARAVQGLGGALVAPATLSILTTTFTQGAERNRALGLWGAMGGVGGAAGGVLGGLLTDTLGWRWVLFINLPAGLAALALALRVVARRAAAPGSAAGAAEHLDVTGALLVTLGLLAVTYGIVSAEDAGWTAAAPLATLAVGGLLLAAFVLVEARVAQRPLLPLGLLRSRQMSGANVVVFLMGSASFAMWYLASLYMQEVLGLSALTTGLALLPMTLVLIGASQAASRLTSRVGAGPVLAVGLTSLAGGMLLFGGVSAGGSWAGDVLAPGLLAGFGIGAAFVPATIAATNGVRAQDAGLASGVVNTSRQMGGTVGLALLATLATQRTAALDPTGRSLEALADGFARAFVVGGGLAFAGALVAVALLVRRPATQPPGPAVTVRAHHA